MPTSERLLQKHEKRPQHLQIHELPPASYNSHQSQLHFDYYWSVCSRIHSLSMKLLIMMLNYLTKNLFYFPAAIISDKSPTPSLQTSIYFNVELQPPCGSYIFSNSITIYVTCIQATSSH